MNCSDDVAANPREAIISWNPSVLTVLWNLDSQANLGVSPLW